MVKVFARLFLMTIVCCIFSFRPWKLFQRRGWWGSVDFCVSKKDIWMSRKFFLRCWWWYVLVFWCVCVSFQAACLLKDQTRSRIRSPKQCCPWRKCTKRSPSWRNWTIIMWLNWWRSVRRHTAGLNRMSHPENRLKCSLRAPWKHFGFGRGTCDKSRTKPKKCQKKLN